MGYEAHSPNKQIWLPLEYNAIAEIIDGGDDVKFGYFAEKYKEKYGIDLHEIFSLKKYGNQFGIEFLVDSISTYCKDGLYGTVGGKFSTYDCISEYAEQQEGEDYNLMMILYVGVRSLYAHGIGLYTPIEGDLLTIDDLAVRPYEI